MPVDFLPVSLTSIDFHPALSAVPGVLLILATLGQIASCFFDREFFRKCSFVCLLLCALVVPLTYYSGYFAAEGASRTFYVPEKSIEYHQSFAQLVFLGVYLTLFFRLLMDRAEAQAKRVLAAIFATLLALTLFTCLYTSRLGGHLVFRSGAGVTADPIHLKVK